MKLFLKCLGINFFLVHSLIASPQIFISKDNSLIDEPIEISIDQLSPYQKIKLQLQTFDDIGNLWVSWGEFQANSSGIVNLDDVAPLNGTYNGIDQMGLFWSLKNLTEPLSLFKSQKDDIELHLNLIIDDQIVSSHSFHRLKKNVDVERISINENGLIGCLFVPQNSKPLPVVIAFTGSNGGLSEAKSKLLASHGFAVFALGYFGMDGLPAQLENIPMEYFEKAFTWLKNHPNIDGSRIGIYGASRGGELVLILGTLFPQSIKAIVSALPSSVYYGAVGNVSNEVPAWTYKGMPLGKIAPYEENFLNQEVGKDPQHPILLTPIFVQSMLKKPEDYTCASIPVENIRCPLMVISGGDDQMWPSSIYAQQIQERLLQKQSSIFFIHLHYPKAGHQIGIPAMPHPGSIYYHPAIKLWYNLGGTPQEDDLASRDSWRKIIDFYKNHL